jgi:pimeloyl-ACP methyl ester carboxylesterase
MNQKMLLPILGVSILFVVSLNFFPYSVNAQSGTLPVVLVHGYFEDASVWSTWEALLEVDDIQFYTVTFTNDDECGSTLEHAVELQDIIDNILSISGSEKVNIVAHSKGGLDSRVYLSGGTDDVANLIMIGTPNLGSPLAFYSDACAPAIWDLRPGARVQEAPRNTNTNYYTISGNWLPNFWGSGGNPSILGPDDGIVPVYSVESESYFKSLGRTWHYHTDLLGEEEYDRSRGVLFGFND